MLGTGTVTRREDEGENDKGRRLPTYYGTDIVFVPPPEKVLYQMLFRQPFDMHTSLGDVHVEPGDVYVLTNKALYVLVQPPIKKVLE